jgi:hypothetical protein
MRLNQRRPPDVELAAYYQTDHWWDLRLRALNQAGWRCELEFCGRDECCDVFHLVPPDGDWESLLYREDRHDVIVLCQHHAPRRNPEAR